MTPQAWALTRSAVGHVQAGLGFRECVRANARRYNNRKSHHPAYVRIIASARQQTFRWRARLKRQVALVSSPVPTVGEALTLLNNVTFDVAIVEMRLGGQRVNLLLDDLRDRNIPVVVVSGYEVPRSIARTVFAVLPKPCRIDALVAVLGTLERQEYLC